MVVGVVAVAAVGVLRVAVALDDAGAGGRAGEATGTSSELIMTVRLILTVCDTRKLTP